MRCIIPLLNRMLITVVFDVLQRCALLWNDTVGQRYCQSRDRCRRTHRKRTYSPSSPSRSLSPPTTRERIMYDDRQMVVLNDRKRNLCDEADHLPSKLHNLAGRYAPGMKNRSTKYTQINTNKSRLCTVKCTQCDKTQSREL